MQVVVLVMILGLLLVVVILVVGSSSPCQALNLRSPLRALARRRVFTRSQT